MTKEKPAFPERGSIELIDEHGNHVMLVWYPIPYYRFEHIRTDTAGKEQELPDCGDRHPSRMKQTFEWVLQHCQKAQKIIDSTVKEIKVSKDDSKRDRKRTRKRKRRKRSVGGS